MPTVRFQQDESEALAGNVAPKSDVARVASNLQMSDYVGKFIANEVAHKFSTADLSRTLADKQAIHVSFSWG
jgi:hypothetical protein